FETFREAFGTRCNGKFSDVYLGAGDVVRLSTSGGGGYGDPLSRDLARIEEDVRQGFVPRAQAEREYQVVFDADGAAVDVEATARGIVVVHTPDACTDEVADHALALLLCLWRKIIPLRDDVLAGRWSYNAAEPVLRIRGRVLGVVGLGRIGRNLVAKARALGF